MSEGGCACKGWGWCRAGDGVGACCRFEARNAGCHGLWKQSSGQTQCVKSSRSNALHKAGSGRAKAFAMSGGGVGGAKALSSRSPQGCER
eukprot:364877-Chlamydomonas_euryale.AAC.5